MIKEFTFVFFASTFILLLLPAYKAEGKAYLTIAFGCTGGKHRSVFITEEVAKVLREKGYQPIVRHRDISQSS